jgi:hypothetical protein
MLTPAGGHGPADGPAPLIPDDALHTERPRAGRAVRILAIGLVLWVIPLIASVAVTGRHSVFTTQDCSSPAQPWLPSAAPTPFSPTPFSPTSPSVPSKPTRG